MAPIKTDCINVLSGRIYTVKKNTEALQVT